MTYNLGDALPDPPIVFLQKTRDNLQNSIEQMEKRRFAAAQHLSQYEVALQQLRSSLADYQAMIDSQLSRPKE